MRSLMWALCREFAKEKERVESRAGFMALKEQQKLEKELTGYVDWICRLLRSSKHCCLHIVEILWILSCAIMFAIRIWTCFCWFGKFVHEKRKFSLKPWMMLTVVVCRAEDLVLAEERTTEADKELIMEGFFYIHLKLWYIYNSNIFIFRDCHGAALLVP